jgi:hypothetical protein
VSGSSVISIIGRGQLTADGFSCESLRGQFRISAIEEGVFSMQASITIYFNPEEGPARSRQAQNSPQLKLQYLQEIVTDKLPSRIDGVVIDCCAAEAVLQVYTSLAKRLQKRLLALPVAKILTVGKILNACSKLTEG